MTLTGLVSRLGDVAFHIADAALRAAYRENNRPPTTTTDPRGDTMPTTIIARTQTGSTYTLRIASEVRGAPTTLRHERDAEATPAELLAHGRVLTLLNGVKPEFVEWDFGSRTGKAVVLQVPGVLLHSSPIVSLTVDGITVPVGVTRMGDR